jgi:hypothetical protein
MREIESINIVKVVCLFYGITTKECFESNQREKIIKARQIVQYFHIKYTKKSLESIGKISLVYGRVKPHNHATILNSKKQVINQIEVYPEYNKEIIQIELMLSEFIEKPIIENFEISKEPVNSKLLMELINLRNENRTLRNDLEIKKITNTELKFLSPEKSLLDLINSLNYQDKKIALMKIETMVKVSNLLQQNRIIKSPILI